MRWEVGCCNWVGGEEGLWLVLLLFLYILTGELIKQHHIIRYALI